MIFFPIKTDFITSYSVGMEKKYAGKSIEYFDDKIMFVFFYYRKYVKLYVVNGLRKNCSIPQFKEPVNKIICFENRDARKLKRLIYRFTKEKDDTLFYLPPIFYRQLGVLLPKKNYERLFNDLLNKYKEGLNNGLYFSYI